MRRLGLAGLLLAAACAGCATPASRIADNQAAFDGYPPYVQQKIRAGEVDVGFTPDMVRMALGDPDRRYTRTSVQGVSEVWAYRDSGPSFGFGLGGASFGHSSAVGGGVGITTGADDSADKVRVVFANGLVAAVERTIE